MAVKVPDPIVQWLLEPDNPPVRRLTLVNLTGRPESDPEVRKAAAACSGYGPTKAILSEYDRFKTDDRQKSYTKYTGRYWQLIFLGQFLADGKDPRIRELAEKLIEDRDWSLIPRGGQCLTANILSALSLLGYGGRPAVKEGVISLAERLVDAGGIDCEVMEYSLLTHCYMAQPKLLMCFASNTEARHSPTVQTAIDLISRNLISHRINVYVPGNKGAWMKVLAKKPDKAALKGKTVRTWTQEQKKKLLASKGLGTPVEKPGWLKPGFPLHYNSDLLEALFALALCGVPGEPALSQPLEVLRKKMDPEGRVIMEGGLNGKMRADVETVGKPSKWLTYRAWHVLRHFS